MHACMHACMHPVRWPLKSCSLTPCPVFVLIAYVVCAYAPPPSPSRRGNQKAFGPSFARADAICREAEAEAEAEAEGKAGSGEGGSEGLFHYAGLDTSLNPALGEAGSICLGLEDLEEVGSRGVSRRDG